MSPHLRRVILAAAGAVALAAAAAAAAAPQAKDAAPGQAARRTIERVADAPAAPQGPVVTEATANGVTVIRTLQAPKGWTVGAPLGMRVEARGEGVSAVDIPAMTKEAGPFEVREHLQARGTAPGTASMDATLVAWEAGELELPAMKASVRRADGTTVQVELPAAKVPIASLVGDRLPLTELAQGLRDPVEIADGRWWWWVLAGAGAAASLAIAWWMMNRPGTLEAEPPLPPDEWALREIERLEADRLPERGEVDGFFVRLSDVVRTYLERRFGIAAPEQTTQEFLRAAGKHPELAGGHERTLAQFLRTADMVKFAAQRPAGTECGRALDAMRGFVRATAPVEPAPGSATAAPGEHPRAATAAPAESGAEPPVIAPPREGGRP
jgi:hypothetical protein